MLLEHVARELIDVTNVIDGLIQYPETVKIEAEFVDYHIPYPDFHVAIPVTLRILSLIQRLFFQVAPLSVLQSVYGHGRL